MAREVLVLEVVGSSERLLFPDISHLPSNLSESYCGTVGIAGVLTSHLPFFGAAQLRLDG